MKVVSWLLFCCLLVIHVSCNKARDNPLDPSGSNYTSPSASISQDVQDGSVLSSNSVTFSWAGNATTNEYRFRLSDYSDWSPWLAATSARFAYLDDTTYTFYLQTRYQGFQDTSGFSRSFVVRANQTAMVKPFHIRTVAAANSVAVISVDLQNISDFFATSLTVQFDKSRLTLRSISAGEVLTSRGYQGALLPDFTQSSVISDANAKGSVDITAGILPTSNAQSRGIDGNGILLQLQFNVLVPDTAHVSFQNVLIKDSHGVTLSLHSSPGAIIVSH